MVAVTKAEKDVLSKAYPNIHFARTMRQRSKRHRYYMEEAPGAMRMLSKLRRDGAVMPAQPMSLRVSG